MGKIVTAVGKYVLLKLLYPHQYNKHSKKPVVKDKVVFLEVRNKTISNSMKEVYNRIVESGNKNVSCHFLGEGGGSLKNNVRNTLAFLEDMATAEFVFLSEANNCFACFNKRNETKVTQLWHGCGAFKKFGLSTAELKFGSSRKQQTKYPLYNNLDLVTVSSDEVIWAYEEAMGIDREKIRATGISRTDVFFDNEYIDKSVKNVHEAIPESKNRKILFYAPTFRGNVTDAKAPDVMDLRMLKRRLQDKYVLLIKHHPFVRKLPEIPDDCRDFAFDVTEKLNIDDLICAGDMCISDYSSLVFEYALFNKPMIFFAYDIEEYGDWRGFYYDYDELTPGPIVKTTEELLTEIEKVEKNFDAGKINEFREKFMSACDGKSTDRILNHIGIEL